MSASEFAREIGGPLIIPLHPIPIAACEVQAGRNGKARTMMTTARIIVPRMDNGAITDACADLERGDPAMRVADAGRSALAADASNARISAAEYEAWLLPPAQRDAMERTVQALSQAAGVLALSGAVALLWLIL